ncbi:hypothetical protein ACFL2H_12065 [Planctomycetota bacterium]
MFEESVMIARRSEPEWFGKNSGTRRPGKAALTFETVDYMDFVNANFT